MAGLTERRAKMTSTTTAPGAMTGERYIKSLKDGRTVWIDGEKVADITVHPAFKDMVHALAGVYDLQNTTYRDEMTYVDPENGVRTSVSWIIPRTLEDSNVRGMRSEE